jgi:hypothetical protein
VKWQARKCSHWHNGWVQPSLREKHVQVFFPWLTLCLAVQLSIATFATAGPVFDTSTPVSFFTNVASRLLASELKVNLSRIQVYPTNQYTPSVHRLLQVTANILDA